MARKAERNVNLQIGTMQPSVLSDVCTWALGPEVIFLAYILTFISFQV